MKPPDWAPPPPDTVLLDPGFECFEMTDTDNDGNWTVDIPSADFTTHASGPSDFKFIITAEEENGMTAIPMVTSVGFTETGLPPADDTIPEVFIERPIDRRPVNGTISINGTAVDNVCLQEVELFVDGIPSGVVSIPPASNSFFEFYFDTTTISNGAKTIQVKAFDTSGNEGIQIVSVTVVNMEGGVVTPSSSVPALSRWAVILMIVAMAGCIGWTLRRRVNVKV
ncbi:Ig-like domain-containing protein [Chloroflexota bacterium]